MNQTGGYETDSWGPAPAASVDVHLLLSNPRGLGHHSSVMTAVRFTGLDLCGMLSSFDLAFSQMQRERERAGFSICILSWQGGERAYSMCRVQ